MNIVLVHRAAIPVVAYGGTERVLWDLGRQLVDAGHRVRFLVPPGSRCDFAEVLPLDLATDAAAQLPRDADIAHFQFQPGSTPALPWLVTEHGNAAVGMPLATNTVFVSRDHAARHGATTFVHNGLDWRGYGTPDLQGLRTRLHFLGKAAWRVKNVQGAIDVARDAGMPLDVLGGHRLNVKRGLRFTLSPRVRFHGMVGGADKLRLVGASRGLVLPVRWHEPFGLAVTESLYLGCAVFATPYGALPELVPPGCGVLSPSRAALADAVRRAAFDPQACHAHAVRHFSADAMARGYLALYARVIDGEALNPAAPALQADARALPWLP